MDNNQYTREELAQIADGILELAAQRRDRFLGLSKKKRKVQARVERQALGSYGKAASLVAKFLTDAGFLPRTIPALTPPTKELADAIFRYRGVAPVAYLKGTLKVMISEFAKSLPGSSQNPPAPIIEIAAKPRAVKKPTRSPKPTSSVDFYWSDEWRTVRYGVLRKSRGVCELCGTAPTVGHPLHVDHIKPRSRYPELELDPTNLQVLCDDCNLGKSNTDTIDWRRQSESA